MVRDLCSKRTAADKIMNKMNENRKIVLDTLNEQNIEYEMFEHQAVYTVDEIEDSDLWNHENGIGAKNLFLRDGSGKHHFLVIIREDKQADLKKVRDEIGSSRLSFASAERLMKYVKPIIRGTAGSRMLQRHTLPDFRLAAGPPCAIQDRKSVV